MKLSRGFTLLEWLISSTIGLFLLSGAFSVYVMSRNNNHQLQIYNELQENGRLAMNLLLQDLRQTGFFGDNDMTKRLRHCRIGTLFRIEP